ncbi:gamma-butyrobetaine hydroxylase-like domain-containing protein [Colwellia sp. 6_MG-2023]|uniref:gamma-butyrobetaine hydroxylase-like domain-containing protein n=1 Tax=Colwellia sp. 6_MG-2023 TaxID=3062676 RepID=UPI0026E2A07B|nr:gamma-butyrobetaine hydroxylase-like domain-containing protein [Colwellia sp. 6_MG-2023]MDO6486513.1 gamma-butyrobetaine hydroxylase-like domain-containing protein [Colwellia sp. 6_MG-2023]
MNIQSFLINTNTKSLTIDFNNGQSACLPFEYLRVFTPSANKPTKQQSLVTHKKDVVLTAIENLGKHGYRFIFDDQHNAIYSTKYIALLVTEQNNRWQHYLTNLKASGHSREAMINITQL